MSGPLDGYRVVDLTSVLMGPLATRILGDLGADVIRVEPTDGDMLRRLGPKRSEDMGWFVLNLQRNKRSVALDLRSDEGATALRDLLAGADAFVTNLRRRALDRLGLDPATVAALNPRLVQCVANGFGSTGPYADRTAYDDVVQSMSGIAALPEWFGEPPRFVPTVLGDKVAGLHIVYAVVAALLRRERTGIGEHIEVPMAECLAAFTLVENLAGHTLVPPEGPIGYDRMRTPHRRPRAAADGWFCFLPYSDRNWHDFLTAAGRPDLADDPRFATRASRHEHADEVWHEIDVVLAARTVAEWLEECERLSVPAAPINRLEELSDDPHFAAVGLLRTVEHPTEGPYRLVMDPVRFSGGDGGLRRPAPALGQHTAELLAEQPAPPDTAAPALDAIRSVLRAQRTFLARADRLLEDHGLTEARYEVLRTVFLADGALGHGEIARRLQVSAAAVTAAVDRLTEAGYLTRREHPDDRRQKEAVLTGLGRSVVSAATATMDAEVFGATGLSAAELDTLSRLLGRLSRSFRAPGASL